MVAFTQIQLCLLCASCPCKSGEYCSQDICVACPENSVSLPGSSSRDDCSCKPGYFDYMRVKDDDDFNICIPCPPGTYNNNFGSICHKCPQVLRGAFSPQASTSVENCSMQLAVDMPRRKDVQEKKSTEKWNQLSADLKQDLKEDDCGRTGCCAGYFYHGEYAVTENGLKIELLQN